MKNHLKRIAAPKTWRLARKENKYVVRPNCGAHSLGFGFALGSLLRDKIGIVKTLREAQKMLNNNNILVDGKRCKDRRHIVGLFDVITLPGEGDAEKNYRVIIGKNAVLEAVEIKKDDANKKIAKVVGKTVIAGGKIQIHLHDGKNLIYGEKVKVGDSVVLNLSNGLKIESSLAKKIGARVFLNGGKSIGSCGKLEAIEGELARYVDDEGKTIETATKYLFVVSGDYI